MKKIPMLSLKQEAQVFMYYFLDGPPVTGWRPKGSTLKLILTFFKQLRSHKTICKANVLFPQIIKVERRLQFSFFSPLPELILNKDSNCHK